MKTYEEAKAKAEKILVKGDHTYNFAQSEMMRDEIIGSTYETRSGKLVKVLEHTDNNNIIIKSGDAYDAVAGVWFIAHIERGSFEKVS
jgi:hypothetical protein